MKNRSSRSVLTGALVIVCSSAWSASAADEFISDPAGGGQSHENHQPGLGINFLVATAGAYPDRNNGSPFDPDRYLGEMTMFAGNYEPQGWSFANGQLLSVGSHTQLFSLFGTLYGGDGRTNFALPDLRSRTPVKFGQTPGLSNYWIGQQSGVDDVTLTTSQMPTHTHPMTPPYLSTPAGGDSAHTNLKPTLAINYFMPNDGGEVRMAGFNFVPNDNYFPDGQLLSTVTDPNLFAYIGTLYGGDGQSNYALPDLRGRLTIHEGQGTGLTQRTLGTTFGTETVTLTESTMPTHGHDAAVPMTNAGGGQAHDNMQPSITLNYIIATQGLFPNFSNGDTTYDPTNSRDPFLGEVRLFAGNFAPPGWEFADGTIKSINQNQPLFSILGTTYGGDGRQNFALPDLRGRVPVHVGGFSGSGPGLRTWQLGEKDGQEMVQLTLDQLPVHTHNYFLPGDLNGDGFVGIDDLNLILTNWNQTVPPGNPLADTNNDGFVGIDDLNAVLGNWNAGTPPAAAPVPEPASLCVVIGLTVARLGRRPQKIAG